MADEIAMAVGKYYPNTAVVIFRMNSKSRQSLKTAKNLTRTE
jgi:hypothetical protein